MGWSGVGSHTNAIPQTCYNVRGCLKLSKMVCLGICGGMR
jgi:hypothetical protein